MFSLAVSVPKNRATGLYDINLVPDTNDAVRNAIQNCDVYTGTRVVAATVLRWTNVLGQCPNGIVKWSDVLRRCPAGVTTWSQVNGRCPQLIREGRADHAEYRVLQAFNTLLSIQNNNDLLLFFVLASPCHSRCTSENSRWNILTYIQQITRWTDRAVVFSHIFKPSNGPDIPENDRRDAIQRLGTRVGLGNIFRCRNVNGMQCTSCSAGTQVSRYCYSDDSQPGSRRNIQKRSAQVGSWGWGIPWGLPWDDDQPWYVGQPWSGGHRWDDDQAWA